MKNFVALATSILSSAKRELFVRSVSAFMMRRTTDLHPGLVFRDIKDFRATRSAA